MGLRPMPHSRTFLGKSPRDPKKPHWGKRYMARQSDKVFVRARFSQKQDGIEPRTPITRRRGIYARLRLALRLGFFFGKMNPKDPKKPKKGKWKRRGKATECMSVQIFCRRGRIERCPTPRPREKLNMRGFTPHPDSRTFLGKSPRDPKKPEKGKGKGKVKRQNLCRCRLIMSADRV